MAKDSLGPHLQADASLPTTSDYLFHLRCNEASAGSNLVDVLGARTMTQVNSPGLAGSAAFDDVSQGARSFNGTTQYAGRAASDGDHTLLQSNYAIAFWCYRENATSVVLEYSEWSSPETSATNVQVRVRIFNGQLQYQWERGSGSNFAVVIGNLPLNEWVHVGIKVSFDPKQTSVFRTIEGFLNGVRVSRSSGHSPPEGGASGRWIVGASRDLGTAVNAPGAYFQGRLDDVIVTKFAPDEQWFRSLYARGRRDWAKGPGQFYSTHARVLVKTTTAENDDVTSFAHLGKVDLDWVDLSSIQLSGGERIDFLSKPVEWDDNIDDLVTTAKVSVFRAWRFYNMSPFVTEEGYDTHNPLAVGDEHLLRPMRRIRIETAIVPHTMHRDTVPAWAWEVQFDGFIRAIDVAEDEVTITCADRGVALLDVFMEPTPTGTDRTYGSSSGTAIEGQLDALIVDNSPVRFQIISVDDNGAGNAIVVVTAQAGDNVINGRGRAPGFVAGDRVVISGTTNFNTPANTTDEVASVNSSSITLVRTTAGAFANETPASGFVVGARWRDYKGAEHDSTPQLWTPVSPSWNVYEWNEPPSKSVLQALDDIVSQIGWRIRYRWHEARQQFRLALYNPAAFTNTAILATTGNYTVDPVLEVRRMSQNVDDVRNVVAVEYYREAAKNNDGSRTINLAVSTDTTSIARYGRRYCRVNVGGDSLINRVNEASNLTNRMRYDLSQPIAEMEIETLFDDRPQVGDLVTIVSESASDAMAPKFFNLETLEGSLVSLRHRVGNGVARTTIGLRNVSGYLDTPVQRGERYTEIVAQVGLLPGRGLSAPKTPTGLSVVSMGALGANRWARASWTAPVSDLNNAWRGTEVHHSATNGFTPSSSTLVAFVDGTQATFSTTSAAGTTLYVRIIHVDKMGNRSAASAQVAYVT